MLVCKCQITEERLQNCYLAVKMNYCHKSLHINSSLKIDSVSRIDKYHKRKYHNTLVYQYFLTPLLVADGIDRYDQSFHHTLRKILETMWQKSLHSMIHLFTFFKHHTLAVSTVAFFVPK